MSSPNTRHKMQAFTLVELIIVIVVISILTAIVALSLGNVQKRSRDAQRNSSVNIIAAGLEAYYNKNGEYPSCSAMTQSASTVTSTVLKGIESSVLQSPGTSPSNGNSITCSDLSASSDSSTYAYVGDGSPSCQTGSACLQWTLKYKEEATGNIISIPSHHSAAIAASTTETVTPTTASASQINVNWNTISTATSYQLQYSTSSSMSSPITNSYSTTSTAITGLSAGTTYYFRVMAIANGSTGAWSNVASATTSVDPPSATPTLTASLPSSTSAKAVVSGGTCVSGTNMEYSIRYYSTSTPYAASWSAWTVGASQTVATSQGYNYVFQAQSRCVGPGGSSTYLTSANANVIQPISTPSPPVFGASRSIPSTMNAGYNYYISYGYSCPSGTTLGPGGVRWYSNEGGTRYPSSSGFYSSPYVDIWYAGWAAGQTQYTVVYSGQYQCVTGVAQSAYSATTNSTESVVCTSARQSYSANPRCDYTGADQLSLPYGN